MITTFNEGAIPTIGLHAETEKDNTLLSQLYRNGFLTRHVARGGSIVSGEAILKSNTPKTTRPAKCRPFARP